MKRRIWAALLAVCLVLALVPTAWAASADNPEGLPEAYYPDPYDDETQWEIRVAKNGAGRNEGLCFLSLKDALEAIRLKKVYFVDMVVDLSDEASIDEAGIEGWSTLDNNIFCVEFLWDKDTYTIAGDLTIDTWVYINNSFSREKVLEFTGSVTVADGGYLQFCPVNSSLYTKAKPLTVNFSNPITVQSGGELEIRNRIDGQVENDTYALTGNSGSLIEVENGGNAKIGQVSFATSSSDPIISTAGTVKMGDFVLADDWPYRPMYQGQNTLVEVKENGSLQVGWMEAQTTGGKPTMSVEQGGSVGLLVDDRESATPRQVAKLTVDQEDKQAIDLAPGSVVAAGDVVVTVGDAPGNNYVDNDGRIVLASGTVQVGDKTTDLSSGGTVTPAADENGGPVIEPNATPATGVTLNQASLSLNPGRTAQLTATVAPENATDTVVWSSDNGAVATVDQNGVVTAVSAGTAQITATAGGQSASCTVTVTFPYIPVIPTQPTQPTKPTQPDTPDGPDTPVVPAVNYADVSTNDWFYDEVSYVTAKGLMTGTTATTFAPNATTTRAMVWTILGRMTGAKVDGGEPWYSLAQSWAMSSGVSDGTNPNGSITREELAVMLYRYAGSPAVGLSELAKLGQFTDGETVSGWAQEAMAWAVSNGVISGSGSALNPQASATRAQVAAMLMRFCETMGK